MDNNEWKDAIQAMQEKQAKINKRLFVLNRRLFIVEGEVETTSTDA